MGNRCRFPLADREIHDCRRKPARGDIFIESIGDLMLENCKAGTVTSNDRAFDQYDRGNGNVDDVRRFLL